MNISTIIFFICLVFIFISHFNNIHEYFNNISDHIIYDHIPVVNSSSLYYDYIIDSPYLYNPLEYWLNPYMYYGWNSPIYTTSTRIHRPSHNNYVRHKTHNRNKYNRGYKK
jgi:hypothetical protein